MDATAVGTPTGRGNSLAITDSAPKIPSVASATISQRDGRHCSRATKASACWWQGADAQDEGIECGIGWAFVAEEPAPQPIVLAIQQP